MKAYKLTHPKKSNQKKKKRETVKRVPRKSDTTEFFEDQGARKVTKQAIIFYSILRGAIDSLGITILTLIVFPKLHPLEVLLLMNGVAVVPMFFQIISKIGNQNLKPSLRVDPKIILLLVEIAGLVLIILETKLYWQIPVGVLFTSFSWWPNFYYFKPHWNRALKYHRYGAASMEALVKLILIPSFSLTIGYLSWDMNPIQVMGAFVDLDTLDFQPLIIQVVAGFVAFFFSWFALGACLQVPCFAFPLAISTPLAVAWHISTCSGTVFPTWMEGFSRCSQEAVKFDILNLPTLVIGGILLWVASIIFTSYLWRGIDNDNPGMLERDLWTQPLFNCVLIEQSLVLNRRKEWVVERQKRKARQSFTFIVTTMWHETYQEMANLIDSLLNIKKTDYEWHEAHIFLDNGFEQNGYYNPWVIQLLDLIQTDLGLIVKAEYSCRYGQCLSTTLDSGMELFIHLKNVKQVKQKKRWSQILYFNLILERAKQHNDIGHAKLHDVYILMTDGDTKFTNENVRTLRELIQRDTSQDQVGAVCGRIVPVGSGSMYWFQEFEYGVGHWLQKSTEHVFGTVLCTPGCFSLVRLTAIYSKSGNNTFYEEDKSVMEIYAGETNDAMEELMMNQGEDRWLSTLLVKNGWSLRYASHSIAETFCPETFEELFKQRRRWISSTMANMWDVIGDAKRITSSNSSVSTLFIIYISSVMFSSLLAPGTVVLIIIGGLMVFFFVNVFFKILTKLDFKKKFAFGLNGTLAALIGVSIPIFYCALCAASNVSPNE